MDNPASNHQPAHSTENTFTIESPDDYRHNENLSRKHPGNHDARNACNSWRNSLLRTPVSGYSSNTNSYKCSSSSFPSATAAPFIPSRSSAVLQPSTTHFSVQDVAQLLASTKKDHLPEWKLSEYNGDPIHWHEWFGQFKSAIDSAQLSDDVKLSYLKTLVTGKAKVAIAEIAYCGAMSRTPSRLLS